jgi:hypothetical protein
MNPRPLRRARQVIWLALIVSVLLHLGLLSRDWALPQIGKLEDPPAPLVARLVLSPPPHKSVVKPAPVPTQLVIQPDPADPTSTPHADPIETPVTVSPEPDAPTAVSEAIPPDAAAADSSLPLNKLPRRITLEYQVHYGLASGKQTLLWVNEGDHYTITSVVAAGGMASLFFSGQLVQTSRGRITATGLQPEEFWDQRGNKRNQSRFDYAAHIIQTDGSKGPRAVSLPEGMQDALSLLFQIALTAPPATDSEMVVFNGKKVRNYRYRVRGEETLNTPLGPLRALRMVRIADTDAERFEIWLAVDRHYLPIKLSTEISGYDAELLMQSMVSED